VFPIAENILQQFETVVITTQQFTTVIQHNSFKLLYNITDYNSFNLLYNTTQQIYVFKTVVQHNRINCCYNSLNTGPRTHGSRVRDLGTRRVFLRDRKCPEPWGPALSRVLGTCVQTSNHNSKNLRARPIFLNTMVWFSDRKTYSMIFEKSMDFYTH
jgi:hypothetical protein